MNFIKKTSIVLTLLVGLMTFASCGDSDDDSSSKNSSKKSSSVSSVEEDEDVEAEDDEDEEEEEEATTKKSKKSKKSKNEDEEDEEITTKAEEEEAEDTTESAAASGTNFKQGKVSGNTYESEFLGVKFTAPSEFTYMSQEQINNTMNNGLKISKTDSSVNDLLKLTTIYDAVAQSTSGETIQFMFENLSKSVPDPDAYDEQSYIKAAADNIGKVSSGLDMKVNEKGEKIMLGGQEFTKFTITTTYTDYNITLDQVMCIKKIDEFMCVVSYSAMSGGDFNDYIDCFEALD